MVPAREAQGQERPFSGASDPQRVWLGEEFITVFAYSDFIVAEAWSLRVKRRGKKGRLAAQAIHKEFGLGKD